MKIHPFAGIAYNAYSTAVGGKSFTGQALPTWDEMVADPSKELIVAAWQESALAVVDAVAKAVGA